MKKQFLAVLLTLAMLLSILPASALAAEGDTAVEPCTVTEGCTLEAGHGGDCVLSDEPEDGDSNGYYELEDVTDGEGGIMLLAEGDTTQPKDGTCGASGSESSVTWTLTANDDNATNPTYTLTISGSGAMVDYGYADSNLPWGWLRGTNNENSAITKLVVTDGVTHIGAWAFWKCTALTEVELPDSLTSIGDSAFESAGLTGTFALKNVTDVNGRAFKNCGISSFTVAESNSAYKVSNDILYSADGKTLVCCPYGKTGTISDSYFSGVNTVGDYAFYKSQLTGALTLPGSVSTIGEYAFQDCTRLTSVSINASGVVSEGAFKGCSGLTSVTIGNDITSIGTSAFENCTAVTSLTLGNSIQTIGKNAFKSNSALSGNLVIPDSVTTIGESAFESCTSLSGTLTLSKNLTSLGQKAFQHTAFTGTLVIPYGITELPTSVFYRNANASSGTFTCIVYPTTLTSINATAFAYNFITQGLYPSTMTDSLLNSNWKPHAAKYTLASGDSLSVVKGSTLSMMTVTPGKVGGTDSANAEYGASNITYESDDTSVATVGTDGTITAVGNAGSKATITALHSGTPFAKVEITVAAKSVNVTMSDSTVDYDGNTKTIGATAGESETLPDDLTLVYSYKESTAEDSTYTSIPPTAPGTYTVKVKSGNSNYTLTGTTTATLTISAPSKTDVSDSVTVTAPASLVYDGTEKTYTATYDGISDWNIVYYDNDGEKMDSAPVDAGGYTVTINGNGESNYASITKEFTITPAALTITANNQTIYEGGTLPTAYTYTVTGLVGNDTESVITIKPTMTCSAADANTAGTYTITASGANAGENYTITYVDGTLTIATVETGEAFKVEVNKGFDAVPTGLSSKYNTVGDLTSDLKTKITTANSSVSTSNIVVYDVTLMVNLNDGNGWVNADATHFPANGRLTITLPYPEGTNSNYKFTVVHMFTTSDFGKTPGDTETLNVTNTSSGLQFSVTGLSPISVGWTAPRSTGSSGGGSSSSSSYTVTVDSAKNGTVKADRTSASKGTTVTLTVTPKDGYELDGLTVTDKNGDTVKLTRKSDTQYTFTMPASKVTVEASFTKIAEQPKVSFVDVPTSAYYYDAVAWAVENGVTAGTSATTFSPDASCTRAQAVTFLWRAAGSPAPKSSVNPFADVPASAYYYDAVLWAVEQGITAGTSATTFSPDATCTRAQIVTFLYRADGTATTSNNPFVDVADSAYYANAVKWAVSEGVTAGTSATTFSPDASCTRAQIVTFLYRAYA